MMRSEKDIKERRQHLLARVRGLSDTSYRAETPIRDVRRLVSLRKQLRFGVKQLDWVLEGENKEAS